VWSVCDPAGLPESIAPGSVDTVVCIVSVRNRVVERARLMQQANSSS
jgi:hypothetical protein